MDCSTDALMQSAKCFRCIPPGHIREVTTYLMCQWAKKSSAGACGGLLWTPSSEKAQWIDSAGPHFADFNIFAATADCNTVTFLGFPLGAGVTSISGVAHLPAILALSAPNCLSLTSVDVSNSLSLNNLNVDTGAITNLNVSGCTALTSLDCNGNQLTSLNCSGLSALVTLICSFNLLGDLYITGCVSLTTLWTINNPALVVHP